MADNVPITAGSGTTIATDDVGSGVQVQRVKPVWGVDGSAVDTSASNPLPTVQTGALPAGDNNIGNVDLASAIPAGTNNIGDVDIASIAAGDNNIGNVDVVTLPALPAGTNNIGDIDVLSVVPGTSATSLGKAIDSAVGSTDTGVAVLAVRDDALSTLTPAESDYVPLRVNSTGALHVTGGGSGTEYTEDAAAAADPVGNALIMVRKDTPATTVSADGDNVALRGSNYGAAYVQVIDATGGAIEGVEQYTEDAAAASDPVGDVLILIRDDALSGQTSADGDNVAARGTDKGEIYVKHVDAITVSSHAVTNAGTFAVQATPPTSGGLSTFNGTSSDGGTALTSTAQAIKASAGQVYGYYIYNPNDEVCFVNFYNTAAGSVTVGTTNPLFHLAVPPASAANLMGTMGVEFTNAGFSISATKTAGSSTAPDVALEAVVWYK